MYRIPQKTDSKINFEQYRQVYQDVKKLNNINFDPTIFYVSQDSTGTYISMLPTTQTEEFNIYGDEALYKVCALRYWSTPDPDETGPLSASVLIPVSANPADYYGPTLQPTWDYTRFTGCAVVSGIQ